MRDIRQGTCPQCDHREVVQAHPKLFTTFATGVYPMNVGSEHQMNIFFCRRCGFAQWYVIAPDKVPISEDTATRLIKGPEPAGPYR
jgi:hypothetical protein